jgi:ParB family chromosome partitioning protein
MKFTKQEIDAIIEASPRTFVPFNKLMLSEDHQARGGGSTPKMSIAELAASIKDSGVLQNLIVVQGARGRYEVCAGGRRLESLTLLVANSDIPENYPVPVLIVPADKGLIASLSENCFHVPMHPADEFAAFAKLIEQGKSVEDVAAAFGVEPVTVKRRMKLASVSPKLMAQYREGDIGLDCLMVLASVDDHDKQEQAWAGLPQWNRRADYLRQLLTQGEAESDRDPVARYVTLKAYEKAGGALRRDLFSDSDKKAYLLDIPLLERLAMEKLQKKARQISAAEGWKWVEVRTRYVYDEFVKFGELRKTRRAPTDDEAARLAALQAQQAGLHEQMEALCDQNDDDPSRDAAYCRLAAEADALGAQIQAIEDALSVWPPELVAQAGCVVFVDNDGSAAVKRGLLRPEDRAGIAQAASRASEDGDPGSLVSLPSPKTRPVHSEKLMRRLTAHRVAAVQAELLARPDVALAAVTAHLAGKIFQHDLEFDHRAKDVLSISATDGASDLRAAAEDMEASPAWARLQADRAAWIERLPKQPEAIFGWVLAQEQSIVLQLLTFVAAVTVKGIHGAETDHPSNEAIAQALGLDMSRWWSATGPSYFDHVSKARVLEVVAEAVDANAASPLAGLKKDAAVAGAAQTIVGLGWLPACLRTQAPAGSRRGALADEAGEPAAADADLAVAA